LTGVGQARDVIIRAFATSLEEAMSIASRLRLGLRVAGLVLAVALATGAIVPGAALAQPGPPALNTTTVLDDLRRPWDIAFAPDGALLFTERCHGLSVRLPDGTVRKLMGNEAGYALRADDLFCQGQSGVHGVAVDPQFAQGQRFVYVFSPSTRSTNPRTNRVIRLSVAPGGWTVGDRTDIVTDIAFKEFSYLGGPGNHSGGRLRFGPDGYLWITTGDNHDPNLPQDPKRLGGKVLRVDRDGKAAPGNNPPEGFDARVYAYGLRNPQGIAFRPGSPQVFIAEHGPGHTDEVTVLRPGGNGGWDPRNRSGLSCREGYCGYAGDARTMPMTDTDRFPNAMRPTWTNNGRSDGMGPAEFLSGPQWGAWNGALAIGLMRGQRIDLLMPDASGTSGRVVTTDLPGMRWRSLIQGPDGMLWASTDGGQVMRIAPR
jgi:aldose sugar dehydrogenase